jgi:hypothetical protein
VSLLNAWITPASAIVYVDTEGVTRGGARKAMSKMLTMPHLPAVVAMRGSASFLAGVFHSCVSRGFDSYDELLAALPDILEYIDVTLPSFVRDPAFPDVELLTVGFSNEHERMLGRLHTKRQDSPAFSIRDTEGCVAPWHAESMSGIPTAEEDAERIARAQVRWMRERQGIGGGKLIACRITPDAISMQHVLEFSEEESACLH